MNYIILFPIKMVIQITNVLLVTYSFNIQMKKLLHLHWKIFQTSDFNLFKLSIRNHYYYTQCILY